MKKRKKAKAKKREPMVTVTLNLDYELKKVLHEIADGASTSIETVCQVLIMLSMLMGRKVRLELPPAMPEPSPAQADLPASAEEPTPATEAAA